VAEAPSPRNWAVELFRRSVLKQRKLAEISATLGPTVGLRCLDLGSDNGVISLLLREGGGTWASGDLTEDAVSSIRSLVERDAHLVRGDRLPFPDASFDRVVVVDMLEHVSDDEAFAAELARVTKPGGRLVVNTPHLKRTTLRRLRHALGQTDEKHGHLRPGYTPARLEELFGARFEMGPSRTYSRFFSELVDTLVNVGLERLGKRSSAKGMVVTGSDLSSHRRTFRIWRVLYPFVWVVTRLDAIVPTSGYMLIATAERRARLRTDPGLPAAGRGTWPGPGGAGAGPAPGE
jgi:SAM-dependent methyltransferase